MYVSTTCSPRNFDLMQKLGASEVIDYKTEKIEDRIVNYDVFIDTMGYINEELVLKAQSKVTIKSLVYINCEDYKYLYIYICRF